MWKKYGKNHVELWEKSISGKETLTPEAKVVWKEKVKKKVKTKTR